MVYWVGLAAVTVGPAIPAILRVTRNADGKGSITASFGDGLRLLVADDNVAIWSLAAPASDVAFWIVGPPLALWLAWIIRRRAAGGWKSAAKPSELPLPDAEEVTARRRTDEHVRPARDRL